MGDLLRWSQCPDSTMGSWYPRAMAGTIRGPYTVQASREIYRNPWIHVREDRVRQPSGRDGVFGVVEMKQGASVLAVTDDLRVYLTREYKYAIARTSTEVMDGGPEG